jgi:hypothetical protein
MLMWNIVGPLFQQSSWSPECRRVPDLSPATSSLPPAQSTEPIHRIVALIMAIGRALLIKEEPLPSYQMLILR